MVIITAFLSVLLDLFLPVCDLEDIYLRSMIAPKRARYFLCSYKCSQDEPKCQRKLLTIQVYNCFSLNLSEDKKKIKQKGGGLDPIMGDALV